MESIPIQMVVILMILGISFTLHVHGKEKIESDRDKIIIENLNSKASETKSTLVAQNENLEIQTKQLQGDLRIEQKERKNLEVQLKQIQEKLSSVIKFKKNIENTSQNYKNLSSSGMSTIVLNGIRELGNIVSNLTKKMSTFDHNLLRLENEIKDSIDTSHRSKENEILPDIKYFAKTEYQAMKSEILPGVRQLETDDAYTCESIYSQQYVPCKEGWFLYGDKCYKLFREAKGWKEASANCSAEGGHLATVSSNELQEFLNAFFLLNERTAAWIGLNDREEESVFVWDDDSKFIYTNWDLEQPDGINRQSKEEDCVEMRFGIRPRSNPRELGYWNDADCDVRLPYICQVVKNKGVEKLSPDPRFCPINEGGGLKYRESCFHIVRTEKYWYEAQKHCEENFSGNLVTILDTEAEMFLNYISSDINGDFWIGIIKQYEANPKWISGWPVALNRLNRDLKQFPKYTGVLRSKNKFWSAAHYSLDFPFICERSKIEAPVLKKAPEGWRCPDASDEWVDLEGESCYIFGKNLLLNWYEANYDCQKKGGNLASITSKEEEMILQPFVLTHSQVFIGLRRHFSNKTLFLWIDGSRMEYTNWGANEPNNIKEECGALKIKYLEYNYTWNDIDCYNVRGAAYICSARKVPPIETTSASNYRSNSQIASIV